MLGRRFWIMLIAAVLVLAGTGVRPAPAMAMGQPCPVAGHAPHHPMRGAPDPAGLCQACCASCLPAQAPVADSAALETAAAAGRVRWFARDHLPDGQTPAPDPGPPRHRS
jgi:hypothetical protein